MAPPKQTSNQRDGTAMIPTRRAVRTIVEEKRRPTTPTSAEKRHNTSAIASHRAAIEHPSRIHHLSIGVNRPPIVIRTMRHRIPSRWTNTPIRQDIQPHATSTGGRQAEALPSDDDTFLRQRLTGTTASNQPTERAQDNHRVKTAQQRPERIRQMPDDECRRRLRE